MSLQAKKATDQLTPTPAPRPITSMVSTFGASRAGNGVGTAKVATSTVKKSSPPSHSSASRPSGSKQNPLIAFALDTENDTRVAAKLQDKKLDHDISNIDVSKAKITLLSQHEAGEIERKHNEHQLLLQCEAADNKHRHEENQVHILELWLKLQQAPLAPQVGDNFAHQPLFLNGNDGFAYNPDGFNRVDYGGGN